MNEAKLRKIISEMRELHGRAYNHYADELEAALDAETAEARGAHTTRMALNLARSLERLHCAVKSLARVKDGKTLFEHSPSKDAEAYSAWTDLDAAQKDAIVKLNGGFRLFNAALRAQEQPAAPDAEAGGAEFETIDGEQQSHLMVVRNLAMLVRRLAYRHPNLRLKEQAFKYLEGEGLQGNIMRTAAPQPSLTEQVAKAETAKKEFEMPPYCVGGAGIAPTQVNPAAPTQVNPAPPAKEQTSEEKESSGGLVR